MTGHEDMSLPDAVCILTAWEKYGGRAFQKETAEAIRIVLSAIETVLDRKEMGA